MKRWNKEQREESYENIQNDEDPGRVENASRYLKKVKRNATALEKMEPRRSF